jgi:hypothetical protein
MATVAVTQDREIASDRSVIKFSWAGLTTTNRDGEPIKFTEYADRSVQAVGTFSAGSPSVGWEGSNDGGTTWSALTDESGNTIAFAAAGLEGVSAITELARPYLTGGDGSTDVDVHVICRRQNNMRT